jgi:hypothetical protein
MFDHIILPKLTFLCSSILYTHLLHLGVIEICYFVNFIVYYETRILLMFSFICGQVTIKLSNYRVVHAFISMLAIAYDQGVNDFCTGWQTISKGNYGDLGI